MSSPYTRPRTEEEELMYDAGLMDGAAKKQERIIALLTRMHDELTDDNGHTIESVVIANAIDRIKGVER